MRTFAQAVIGESSDGILLKEAEPPRAVGRNIAITIDKEEYDKGLVEFTHSQIGRMVFTKGDKPYKNEDVKWRLSGLINKEIWRLTPLGRGYYNVHLPSHVKKAKYLQWGQYL